MGIGQLQYSSSTVSSQMPPTPRSWINASVASTRRGQQVASFPHLIDTTGLRHILILRVNNLVELIALYSNKQCSLVE